MNIILKIKYYKEMFIKNRNYNYFKTNILLYNLISMGIGDWGLGIGDWGLGIGPNPQSPIPKPQSPIPNPQSPFL